MNINYKTFEDVKLYINSRIEFYSCLIERNQPKLPDTVASLNIEIAEQVIEELMELKKRIQENND
jgi:hypothetical protein